jgi:Rrf2 family nitric oxide-sensitive transcriptional repressor
MRLTTYTDYALRTLMYLAVNRDRLVTIQDIASLHSISKNHLTKVVHHLGQVGIVATVRGRNGGLKLGLEPVDINIGAVVRQTETDFHMAECFHKENNRCVYASACVLEDVLGAATAAYLKVLDGVSLEDLVRKTSGRSGQFAVAQNLQFHPKATLAG